MKSFFILSTILVFIKSSEINIWPWPKMITKNMTSEYVKVIKNNVQIIHESKIDCDIVKSAINRYAERMFIQDCSKLDQKYGIKPISYVENDKDRIVGEIRRIIVNNRGRCEDYPHLDMDESYHIEITPKDARIVGYSPWGVLRGLETFSQLIESISTNIFRIPVISIEDEPRFKHRGLLIDSGRHYLSIKSILQTLDAMEMNKMNVLHWHIVDDQSFPYVSDKFPELSLYKSFNLRTHVYTKEDIQMIVEYSRMRGIRVIPEFDTPGHTKSWGKHIKGLLTECYNFKSGLPNGQFGPIHPTREFTFKFLTELFEEIVQRFPDRHFHIGGDEVPFECWYSNPEASKFLDQNNMTKTSDLEAYFVDRIIQIMNRLERNAIVWQEVFANGVKLPKNAIVQVWQSWPGNLWNTTISRILKNNHRAILSAPWYLDLIRWGKDWDSYYNVEPLSFDNSNNFEKLLLGGEACLWGEYVDSSNLISRAWPRASAIAERLWSPKNIKNIKNAQKRIIFQQCRMQQFGGLRVSPVDGPNFCQCDYAL